MPSDASERRLRILVLNERDPLHPKAGGAELHVSEIFGRLARRGHHVRQLSSGFRGGAARELVGGVHVERLGPLPAYYPRVPGRVFADTRTSDPERRVDVVVECLNKIPYASPVYSKAPVLALCHHLFGEVAFQQVAWPIAAAVWSSERIIPPLYRRCRFVAISESSAADLVRRGIPAERVSVSHPGIEPPRIEVDPAAKRPCRVAFVGRLEAYKKVDVMLRAMARLSHRHPEAEIVVIGRGPARASLEALAKQLGLEGRTRFTGFVSDEERDRLLAEARVCVCPSEKEGWGLTVIESNAVGTPVVATQADGLRDSVRNGETGYLVPDEDVDGFAAKIAALLEDEALRQQMSRAALAWSRRFDWELAADDMEAALVRAWRDG